MPHSVQPVQPLANTEAVKRARNQATVVTCAASTVPTVLAMQGMASLAVDLLHFPVVVAIALAGFLELALISFALLTRASALAGRPGGVDAAAVWGVSLASGTFSALHELVGPAIGNTRAWQVDPGSLLAACVRLTAPLVAALLWERVLTAARREHEARSLVQVRRDHPDRTTRHPTGHPGCAGAGSPRPVRHPVGHVRRPDRGTGHPVGHSRR